MWFQIFLPVVGSVVFLLLVLLRGETHLYQTAVPVWLFAATLAHTGSCTASSLRYAILLWIVAAGCAILYTVITAGRMKFFWILWFLTGALTAATAWGKRAAFTTASTFTDWCGVLQNILMMASLLFLSLAIDSRPEGYPYCPTWGDRSDGRRVRTIPAMSYVVPYIMPHRAAASNFIRETLDLSLLDDYIAEKRRQGLNGFGVIHVFLAAYARVVARYPAINRFCSGQHVFSRGRDLEFVMAVKIQMTTDAPDTMIKVHFDPADTADTVYEKLNKAILEVKNGPLDSDFDKTAKLLTYVPGLFLTFVVQVLKFLDYFGLLPKFLLNVSPFHGSVILTSMASLGIPPIVHHLYDFGNLPIFIALGNRYRRTEVRADGTVVQKKYVDYTVNTDERICDGFYFASCIKYMKRILNHPEILDQPPETIAEDIP